MSEEKIPSKPLSTSGTSQNRSGKISLKERVAQRREQELNRQYSDVSEQARKRAEALYRKGKFMCSETVFSVVNDHLGQPADPAMVKMASGFPVGIAHSGCICGAVAGGVMALGLDRGREKAGEKVSEELFPLSAELHDRFILRNKYVCCRKLIKNMEFGSTEHIQQCIRFTGEIAADVVDLLENGVQGHDTAAHSCEGCEEQPSYRITPKKRSFVSKVRTYFSLLIGKAA
ncbi:C-GCAxxG-C-C family protein [Sansalvadorimonas sp. 2012CJ34-2]|uniref:C-GCAxxG-C-C family protein n=1 Tax=Parendozoicomonas callyspongiae TaxID=2942213 RepID=A0ABT0PKE2_9GAMM|nr:C-GCAxxG-C-C family protein [Sansalvadorimonas sp. 2012CJ34-2]MCL6271854.1 C-GCAxxG-C-C family protein [Sansalvadorimonas sp. 2012CJ34-2]